MADATMDEVVERLTIHSAHYPDLRVLLAAYQLVREENARMRRALQEIADADYRGNRSHESTLAYRALSRAMEGEPRPIQYVDRYGVHHIVADRIAWVDVRNVTDARTGGTE